MLDYSFYNMDCMDGMKQFPDKYFDLAIVDPPYGDGGGSGNIVDHLPKSMRKRERERERNRTSGIPRETLLGRAEHGRASSAKKSFRGTQPRSKTILKNCFVSHVTKLFGGAITSIYRRRVAF